MESVGNGDSVDLGLGGGRVSSSEGTDVEKHVGEVKGSGMFVVEVKEDAMSFKVGRSNSNGAGGGARRFAESLYVRSETGSEGPEELGREMTAKSLG